MMQIAVISMLEHIPYFFPVNLTRKEIIKIKKRKTGIKKHIVHQCSISYLNLNTSSMVYLRMVAAARHGNITAINNLILIF